MNRQAFRFAFLAGAMLLSGALGTPALAQPASPASASATPATAAIPDAALLQPEALAQMLRTSAASGPLILQVGSHVLYAQAHVPGAEYVGAAGQEAGLQALEARVKNLERSQALVIYCGCCPWKNCPNIRPAYWQLQRLGFSNVKVLYIADNFGADWAARGYPVATGR